jgi:protein TonB
MLFRALLISVLSHLAILLSLSGFVLMGSGASGGREGALGMTLHQGGGQALPSSNTPAGETPVEMPNHVNRRPNGRPIKNAVPSVLPPFLPSTAAIAKSRQIDDSGALKAEPSELLATSAELVKEYQLNVARKARQFKEYPALARESGWEGVALVMVAMPMGAGSSIVSLERSSGHQVLDRQALEMVERAVRLAALPDGMRGRQMKISLPVEYRLAD